MESDSARIVLRHAVHATLKDQHVQFTGISSTMTIALNIYKSLARSHSAFYISS